jgi:hypothetical protein
MPTVELPCSESNSCCNAIANYCILAKNHVVRTYDGRMAMNQPAMIGPCGPRPPFFPGAGGGASAGGAGAGSCRRR